MSVLKSSCCYGFLLVMPLLFHFYSFLRCCSLAYEGVLFCSVHICFLFHWSYQTTEPNPIQPKQPSNPATKPSSNQPAIHLSVRPFNSFIYSLYCCCSFHVLAFCCSASFWCCLLLVCVLFSSMIKYDLMWCGINFVNCKKSYVFVFHSLSWTPFVKNRQWSKKGGQLRIGDQWNMSGK